MSSNYQKRKYKEWKVRFDKGTVIIGSALNGWAISSYSKMIPHFDMIIKHHEEDNIEQLRSNFPIVDAFLTSIINNIPSPKEAQLERVQHITQFIDEGSKQAIQECNDVGPLISCLGKLLYEDNRGIISVIRIFSGSVKSGSTIRNRRTGETTRVQQVCIYKGQSLETIGSVGAGNIAVIIGLKNVQIGDTIVVESENPPNVLFNQIFYLQESVISQRIEPIKVSDIPKLQENLEILSLIKPNFHNSTDENTGEMKIYGIGELQLEIIIGEIEKSGIAVEVSNPEVTLIEQIEEEVRLQKIDYLDLLKIELTCM
ncbi:MAG: EF-Tu/IF-2/RF-3 family GTPase, partial [Candidatus Heimdallarchaeaceae archaeon]